MSRYNPIQSSFVSGELSPRLEARDDLAQYLVGMRQALNGIVLPHGGFMRRTGTRFAAEVKTSSKRVRLVPFEFSTAQAYVCEFGDIYTRFYTNEGRLESPPGTPVEVVSPFVEADVPSLQHTQEADVMWVVHPNYHPYKLSRTSATTFTLTRVVWRDGHAPLRAKNLDATNTLTVTGSGPYTLTWVSNPVAGGLVSGTDVGRAVRTTDGTDESWFEITSVSSALIAVADLKDTGSVSVAANDDWAVGLFSDTEGPRTVVLHEGRLGYGGARLDVDRFVLSVSDDFDNFDLDDGTEASAVNDDRSISRRTTGGGVNAIQWMESTDELLAIGTSGGEFTVRGDNDDLLTPAGTKVKKSTKRGSPAVRGVIVDNQVLYLQRNSRKLRKFGFDLNSGAVGAFTSQDISILAEHILDTGGTQTEYKQDPDSVVYIVRTDGQLVGFTYEAEQKVIGAHRHRLGGTFDGSKFGIVESIAVIPEPLETEDQLWVSVKRTINGVTKRYIEFQENQFRPIFDNDAPDVDKITALDDAFFIDSGLTLDIPLTITAITNADPAVVSVTDASTLTNGETVKIRAVVGALDVNNVDTLALALNLRSFTVAGKSGNTFELEGEDTSSTTAYVRNGTAREEVLSISGLGHLEGETVQILADGAVHPDRVVASSAITLARKASIVHVGLGFITQGETQRFTGGGRLGTDQGQQHRIQRIVARLHNTIGSFWGQGANPNPDTLEPMLFRDGNDPMDASPPLFSGDKEIPIESGWTKTPTVFFQQAQPLPFTVLSIMPRNESGEK